MGSVPYLASGVSGFDAGDYPGSLRLILDRKREFIASKFMYALGGYMAQPSSRRTLGNARLRLGTFLAEIGDSRLRAAVCVAVVGITSGFLEYVIHESLRRASFAQSLGGIMDASIVALAAAAAATVWLLAARERRKRVLQEMRKIADLNHNVRNALQVIVHSHHGPPDEHTGMVLDSVERIERTLRELFPIQQSAGQEKRNRMFMSSGHRRIR